MARTVNQINATLTSQIQTTFASLGITIDIVNWSQRNIIRLLCYSFSICSAYIEQLMDALMINLEVIASQTPAASKLWIQAKMFLFQYSATTPQIIQLTNLVPQYPVIDPTLQIIKACSVDSVVPNEVIVKVAKLYTDNITLIGLTTDEANAAQSYINTVGDSGVQYQLISQAPDLMYIAANIYYTGQYSTIYTAVTNALTSYMQNLSLTNFDGSIKVSDIENTIRSIVGVNDVTLTDVVARPSAVNGIPTTFSLTPSNTTQILVQGAKVNNRQWKTIAGYCTGEIAPNDFITSLNFTAE